jgi:uncharacterized protein YukE
MSYFAVLNVMPRTKSEFNSVYDSTMSEISRLSELARKANHVYNNHDEQRSFNQKAQELQEAFNQYDDRVRSIFNDLPS